MKKITDENAGHEISNAENPLLVKFTGEECSACKMLDAPLSEIAAEGEIDVVSADVADCGALANRIGVRGLPLMALYVNGKLLNTKSGAASKSQIQLWIKGALG